MSIRNSVQLIGNVGVSPEFKTLENGGQLARFSLATNENYKNKLGEWVDQTTWHNIIAWNQVAERIEKQIKKGSKVLVQGKIINRQYQDKDGITRYITEIEVRSFLSLDGKKDANLPSSQEAAMIDADGYEDLPF